MVAAVPPSSRLYTLPDRRRSSRSWSRSSSSAAMRPRARVAASSPTMPASPGSIRSAGRDPPDPCPQRRGRPGRRAAGHPVARPGRRTASAASSSSSPTRTSSWPASIELAAQIGSTESRRARRSSAPASPPSIASLERQRALAAGQVDARRGGDRAAPPGSPPGRRHPAPGRGQPLGAARPPRRGRKRWPSGSSPSARRCAQCRGADRPARDRGEPQPLGAARPARRARRAARRR